MPNDQMLEHLFMTYVESAAVKNYTFESPRDDEAVALAVAHWDCIIGVWQDDASPNGFKMAYIKEPKQTKNEASFRGNCLMCKNEATAKHWHDVFNWQATTRH
jgi:hypothetical protein